EDALPAIAQAMMAAAEETGDADQVAAVANAVAEVFPDFADAIAAEKDAATARLAALSPAPVVEDAASPDDATEAEDALDGFLKLGRWTGTASAGATLATGNSENVAAGFGFDAKREAGNLVHAIKGGYDIASASGVRTQKRWFASYQLDAQLSERTYAYGRFSYEEDEFSGFDYRLFGGAGVGHFLYKSKPFTWKVEGGPGYQFSPIDDTQDEQSEIAFYASTELDWVIREGVTFQQDVDVTWTDPTTTVSSLTALTTDLTDSISTSLSYLVRYETNPPLDRENVDTLLKASVNYGF
ncbi:MAG: DUF481 domain-containing protein, partial [Pseudomonadota bacterium]